jgi:hypothetical protein
MDLIFLDTLKLEDGSGFRNFIRMTPTDFECLENDRWQNIKREYKIFPNPLDENSERTDALAVAMPPNTSTLEMLCNIASMNRIPDVTQGTRI